ncbi:hypothetical protein [Ornithinimicrobium kibberense]
MLYTTLQDSTETTSDHGHLSTSLTCGLRALVTPERGSRGAGLVRHL